MSTTKGSTDAKVQMALTTPKAGVPARTSDTQAGASVSGSTQQVRKPGVSATTNQRTQKSKSGNRANNARARRKPGTTRAVQPGEAERSVWRQEAVLAILGIGLAGLVWLVSNDIRNGIVLLAGYGFGAVNRSSRQ